MVEDTDALPRPSQASIVFLQMNAAMTLVS